MAMSQAPIGITRAAALKRVAITCALTGAGDTVARHPAIPVTPAEIAAAAIDAARAGAAIVHIHVRDPATGKGGRDPSHFREVVQRIRDSDTDIVLNLTAGMGGNLHRPYEDPTREGPDTDLVSSSERFRHIEELRPEICTIDCGTMNFGADSIATNRRRDLVWMATRARELGVKPELEIFDMGQMGHALELIDAGLIEDPPMFQFCLGIAGGAPATTEAMQALRSMLPPKAHWAAFGISRHEFPMLMQAVLLGGHVRVGLEDNLYLQKGVFATNGTLVEKAVRILAELEIAPMTPAETRTALGLAPRN
jgi:uncharacterized protein (DUF849 family)